jgi:hypothetical protein
MTTADEFLAAAQALLGSHDGPVYLLDAEGAIFGALVPFTMMPPLTSGAMVTLEAGQPMPPNL